MFPKAFQLIAISCRWPPHTFSVSGRLEDGRCERKKSPNQSHVRNYVARTPETATRAPNSGHANTAAIKGAQRHQQEHLCGATGFMAAIKEELACHQGQHRDAASQDG